MLQLLFLNHVKKPFTCTYLHWHHCRTIQSFGEGCVVLCSPHQHS